MNVANTSVIPWRGELLALWEAGAPYRLDADSLETLGVKDFGDVRSVGLPPPSVISRSLFSELKYWSFSLE